MNTKKMINCLTFPLRSLLLQGDREFYGISSLVQERQELVKELVSGYCLDVGCGSNSFINKKLNENGVGVDIYKYNGQADNAIILKPTSPTNIKLPFKDNTFDTITLIASINHISKFMRTSELKEAYRVLKEDGKIIVTAGFPLAEIFIHIYIIAYDMIFKTRHEIDFTERRKIMCNNKWWYDIVDEDMYISNSSIKKVLQEVGFIGFKKKYFWTQWMMNHAIIGYKGGNLK